MAYFGGSMAPSLADIAAVTNRNGDGYDGFGGQWWAWIILFALFGGWGNGYGYGNGGGQGVYDVNAAVQRGFDTQTVVSKLDGINSGICSLGYDQLAQMNGIQNTVMQTGFGLQNSINQNDVNAMRNTFGIQSGLNDISHQISDCCCTIRNQMQQDNCQTNMNIHQTGDAVIQNQNAGFTMLNNTIRDGFCNLEMREMQRENANLRMQLNDCNRDNALQDTANYILRNMQNQNGCGCCNQRIGCWG